MKNKLVYALIIVIVLFIGVGIYSVINRVNDNNLKKEVNTLSGLNFYNDKFDRDYVTSFKYKKVEEAIKSYLEDYSNELKKIKSVTEDEELKSILTIDVYKKDGPKFTKSHEYIKKIKDEYNNSVDKLLQMSDSNYFNSYIDNYTKSKKYVNLYKKLIKDEKLIEKVDNKVILEKNKTLVNTTLDNTDKVLDFLTKNEKDWEIEDGKLKFTSNKLLQEYNKLIKKV